MKAAIYTAVVLISCSLVGSPAVGPEPQGIEDFSIPGGDNVQVSDWVTGLRIPWSLVFLSDGRALVSERPGNIRLIKDGKLADTPYAKLDVAQRGEGGLMGIAVHPDFPNTPYVYVMHTYSRNDILQNRIVRLRDRGQTGEFDRVILDGIPGAFNHNGGRIAFGPDGMLYATAGETFQSELAQDLASLGGKILRVTPDGEIPYDNPFPGSPVYSLGHRNPQGLAWGPDSKLYASEHGPSGEFGKFAHDEINVIVKGGNYGWPKVIGAPSQKPYRDPLVAWKRATPPSGMTFYSGKLLRHLMGDLFVATLGSKALIRIQIDEKNVVTRIERWFEGRHGRLRDVVEGPDGALYVLTNNTDGRGRPRPSDDRILRISPKGN